MRFYEGCDTTYRLISCQKADVFIFRLTYGYKGIDVVFFTRDLKIVGKTVREIEQYRIKYTDEAEAVL